MAQTNSSSGILVIIPNLSHGGAQQVCCRLCDAWEESGIRVNLIVFDVTNSVHTTKAKILSLHMPINKSTYGKLLNWWQRARALVKIAKEFNPNQIIAIGDSAAIPVALAKIFGWIQAHVTVSIRNDVLARDKSIRWVSRILYRHMEKIVLPSITLCQRAVSIESMPFNKCIAIHNPLNALCLMPIPEYNQRERMIIACGRLEDQKGFDVLIRAFQNIANKCDFNLVILGEGSRRAKLESMIEDMELTNRVHLQGAVNNPLAWMRRARLFVLSSRYEGFPNVLAEAMACGCPCVSTDCMTGPSEMIIPNESGLLVAVEHEDELAKAMLQMLNDDVLAEYCGNNARMIAETWKVEKIAPQWLV